MTDSNDLNDLSYFVSVVRNEGFSAASRTTGVEKTRLSRRVAALETTLGVRLLQRTTRSVALTEAGQRFYAHAQAVVEGAQVAFDSVADLRREPAGTIRLACPQVMAQTYLAPILPAYLIAHPKVKLELDATDRQVDLFRERYDLALRAYEQIPDTAGIVARPFGNARRVLVASPALLDAIGRPQDPQSLNLLDTIGRPSEVHDGTAKWLLQSVGGGTETVAHSPRLSSDDLRMQLEAAIYGVGVALLPEPIVAGAVRGRRLEIILPEWSAATHIIHVAYPRPKGMLPSVRSLLDYLSVHLPASIQGHVVDDSADHGL